jgi:hypothetical protein
MSDLSRELIQQSREAYANLTRAEGADYFEAQEAFNRSVQDARIRHREQLSKASSVNDLAPDVLAQITKEMESGAREWAERELDELDQSQSKRRAAAIRLAQSENPPMDRKEMEAWYKRYGLILDPLPHLLTLCEGREYPQVLFWKDKLVKTLSYVPGAVGRNNETGNGFEADVSRFWTAINERCASTSATALPCLSTISQLGERDDFLDGLRIVNESSTRIHEIGVQYAIPPKPADPAKPSHPGRQLPSTRIGPMKHVTGSILHLHAVLGIARDFIEKAAVNPTNTKLAIGFLANRESLDNWSMLVAMLDSLLGKTDVPYEGLILREGRSPYLYYDHGPMHRYGRAQAHHTTLHGTLEAGERLFAAMDDYLTALRLGSADALVAPLREMREPACTLASLDGDV